MIGEQAFQLEEIVSIFLLIVGAGCLFGGYRLFAAGVGIKGHNLAPASFFAGFGALVILAVIWLTLGPWRLHYSDVFPMRVPDLNAPPAPVERPSPPAPNGGPTR
ncbi:MAG TPA: hypothetical protein VN806_12865 [Caulobacteraceae bacterium]|nr:hypothetical protein [Caulobacteraceae bacterium]